jgi:hypothetical protein
MKNERQVPIEEARNKPQKPRKGTSLIVAGSLVLGGGCAALLDRDGPQRSERTASPAEIDNKPIIGGETVERRPLLLELGSVSNISGSALEISYDSVGLAGKMDVTTNKLVGVPTKIVESDEINKEVVMLAKIRRDLDGKVTMTDISPTGMDSKARKWFQETMAPILPLLDAAFDVGGMYEMTIGTQTTPGSIFRNHSQYNARDNSVFADLNLNDGIVDPFDFQATIVHEVTHSIFAKKSISHSIKEHKPHEDTVEKFATACRNLRDIAIDELELNSSIFIEKLENTGEKIPTIKAAVEQLIQAVREKNLNGLFPQQGKGIEEYTGIDTCRFIGGSGILSDISKSMGVNFDFDLSENGTATRDEKDVLREIDAYMKQFVHKDSIYRIITDATYVMDPQAGHPYDNLDEAAASLATITVLAPEKFGDLLFSLPPESMNAIVDFYLSVMQELTSTSPKLEKLLTTQMDKVFIGKPR